MIWLWLSLALAGPEARPESSVALPPLRCCELAGMKPLAVAEPASVVIIPLADTREQLTDNPGQEGQYANIVGNVRNEYGIPFGVYATRRARDLIGQGLHTWLAEKGHRVRTADWLGLPPPAPERDVSAFTARASICTREP